MEQTEGALGTRMAPDTEPLSQASELDEDEDMSESISDLPSIRKNRGSKSGASRRYSDVNFSFLWDFNVFLYLTHFPLFLTQNFWFLKTRGVFRADKHQKPL